MKIIFKFAENLLSLFYPRFCPSCNSVMHSYEDTICINCLTHLPETNYHSWTLNPLEEMLTGRIGIERVSSLLFYKKNTHVQQLLHKLKYKGMQNIGIFFGNYYGNKLLTQSFFQTLDCILPIPLHPRKLKERGYNQSESFAKGLSQSMNIPYYTDVLIRKEYTVSQTTKSRFDRWENVKDVFEVVKPEIVESSHVLVCDDVLTTGATIEAAVAALKNLPDVKISVVTLATAV